MNGKDDFAGGDGDGVDNCMRSEKDASRCTILYTLCERNEHTHTQIKSRCDKKTKTKPKRRIFILYFY